MNAPKNVTATFQVYTLSCFETKYLILGQQKRFSIKPNLIISITFSNNNILLGYKYS